MTALEALILGIIQGITEFLPISSSGHLALVEYFLGLNDFDHAILFSLVCHLGTLFAIVITLFHPIKALFYSDQQRLKQIIIGTMPLFPLAFLMKPIKAAYAHVDFLGYFFLLTAFILFLGIRFGKITSPEEREKKKWQDALLIGCCQALAVLPGISRSGATISGARLLGWSVHESVIFSFLLAIPAVLGGTTLETYHLITTSTQILPLSFLPYLIGFTASFAFGLCSFQLLLHLFYRKFSPFAWYCLFLGLAATFYFRL